MIRGVGMIEVINQDITTLDVEAANMHNKATN